MRQFKCHEGLSIAEERQHSHSVSNGVGVVGGQWGKGEGEGEGEGAFIFRAGTSKLRLINDSIIAALKPNKR